MKTWILDDADRGVWICSECGLPWQFSSGGPRENQANYCPRCGEMLIHTGTASPTEAKEGKK